jgi:hypothetical protein
LCQFDIKTKTPKIFETIHSLCGFFLFSNKKPREIETRYIQFSFLYPLSSPCGMDKIQQSLQVAHPSHQQNSTFPFERNDLL